MPIDSIMPMKESAPRVKEANGNLPVCPPFVPVGGCACVRVSCFAKAIYLLLFIGQPVAPWLSDSSWEIVGVAPTAKRAYVLFALAGQGNRKGLPLQPCPANTAPALRPDGLFLNHILKREHRDAQENNVECDHQA